MTHCNTCTTGGLDVLIILSVIFGILILGYFILAIIAHLKVKKMKSKRKRH